MAYRPNDPNDPFITPPADAPPPMTDPVLEPNRYDEDSGISGTRIALYAVAVLAVVGALFYGMSATTTDRASNSNAPVNNMASERPATPPPAVRDVTPRNNTEPGMTTGSAPAQTSPETPAPAQTPPEAPANPAGSAQ